MKKIGVCACYNTKNYGSMLQTLATGVKLQELGYDFEFIRYTRKPTIGLIAKSLTRIPELIGSKIKHIHDTRKIKAYPEIAAGINRRNDFFNKFVTQTFESISPEYKTYKEIRKAALNYSAVLVGSDQLWRPEGYGTGFYNLLFVPDEILKISYATSFGVSKIPNSKKRIAKRFLNRINYISVRELRAAEIVKELTGRNVPTVVDPTLLFTGEQWKNLIPEKTILGEKYIFCYFLGSNKQHRIWAKEIKKETGYKIVTIPHLDEFVEGDIDFGDIQLYDVGPSEFVNLIRYAEIVCTDSFHGTVFSILNHKSFITFNRFSDNSKNSRNSRIESLLSQTKLMERRIDNEKHDIISTIRKEIDYSMVDKRLWVMRVKSISYLENAFKGISKKIEYKKNNTAP